VDRTLGMFLWQFEMEPTVRSGLAVLVRRPSASQFLNVRGCTYVALKRCGYRCNRGTGCPKRAVFARCPTSAYQIAICHRSLSASASAGRKRTEVTVEASRCDFSSAFIVKMSVKVKKTSGW
jgi:hypothetical protein